jgi:hypothetical protein
VGGPIFLALPPEINTSCMFKPHLPDYNKPSSPPCSLPPPPPPAFALFPSQARMRAPFDAEHGSFYCQSVQRMTSMNDEHVEVPMNNNLSSPLVWWRTAGQVLRDNLRVSAGVKLFARLAHTLRGSRAWRRAPVLDQAHLL